jgi:hypothetical protein
MKAENLVRLKAIAAQAELLALKVEKGQLWPGELEKAVNELQSLISGISERNDR